jgi:DNA-binding CsgD family transcriptional regulator
MTTAGIDLTREAQAERQQRVVELTRTMHSASDIAFILGVSPRTVERYRRRAGISQGGSPRTSDEVLAAAEALLSDGASYKEVGKTLGISYSTVAKWLPGRGWTPAQIGQHARCVQMLATIKPFGGSRWK